MQIILCKLLDVFWYSKFQEHILEDIKFYTVRAIHD